MTGATKKEMEKFAKHIINGAIEHLQTSPNTQKQSNDITELLKEKNCVKNESRLKKLEDCIYGDKEDETNRGIKVHLESMESKIDTMNKSFEGFTFSKKLIIGIAVFISTVLGGIYMFIDFLKRLLVS